ncbi:hypothetical protein D3C79_972520 [compost metagenome]
MVYLSLLLRTGKTNHWKCTYIGVRKTFASTHFYGRNNGNIFLNCTVLKKKHGV